MDEWIPSIIAWLGVVVTFVFARRSHRASQQANAIQREMLALLEKAELDRRRQLEETDWRIDLERGSSRVHLLISCLGPAAAADVEVLVDGRQPDDAGLLRETAGNAIHMERGSKLRFTYAVVSGSPRINEVSVRWTDSQGQRHTFDSAVGR